MTSQNIVVEERLHALDASRAFVLLLGVFFHGALSEVFPPSGIWAVGTAEPSLPFWWFIFTSHLFRMEVFFLLAGFFACLVVSKRGASAFMQDRFWRIALVFLVFLYPIKYIDSVIWITGGLKTGWLHLPPDVVALGPWKIARYALAEEKAPQIHLNHLWFLYYLFIISISLIALRASALRWWPVSATQASAAIDKCVRFVAASRYAPLWLGAPLLPLLWLMDRYDVATPDKSLIPMGPSLALYGYFFLVGWWLYRNRGALPFLQTHWRAWLVLALFLSLAGWAGDYHLSYFGETMLVRIGAITANAITIGAAVLGLIGLFLSKFAKPSPSVRYLADAAYWTYLVHLPVVVLLQVWFSDWGSGVARVSVATCLTFVACLGTYHLFVRNTLLGRWLRGRPLTSTVVSAESE